MTLPWLALPCVILPWLALPCESFSSSSIAIASNGFKNGIDATAILPASLAPFIMNSLLVML
ncbi:MAG: hypothetical protein C4575_06705 [Desulforudis sp.]|nr:MAG: hypothetical protein C4575_06705 [Desulforudis sp.]